jgi:hypothetical protein
MKLVTAKQGEGGWWPGLPDLAAGFMDKEGKSGHNAMSGENRY